jgi:hypothetical protein
MLALHALVRVVSKVEEEQKEIIGENIQNFFLHGPVAPRIG